MRLAEYNSIVDKYADGLYRFMIKLCGEENQASDLVQDCFEKLWIKRDTVEVAKAKSYLFTIGYNTFINSNKRAQKISYQSSEELVPVSSSSNGYNELKEVLDLALDKLPEIQKTVVLLRDYEGYDYSEIGEICNLSLSQVKVYIFRARKFLKNELMSLEELL